jgi:xanthine/CO dehydrogenase XdhC/CoxF family maturation factor
MKELNDIILAYNNAVLQNKQTALATVVKVEGSSYRRPGARMLVTEDGKITGAISGGCLEGDALRKAQFAMFQQRNKIEIYDTTHEDDAAFGIQLGCNGIVYILFEPIEKDDPNNPISLLKKVAKQGKDAVLVTLFSTQKNALQRGTCCFINKVESHFAEETKNLKNESEAILRKKTSVVKQNEASSILYQFIPPSIQLVIVGAGNDAQPLANMAFLMGWNVIIVDGRPAYATQQRFQNAKISLTKPGNILSAIEIDEHTAVVLMTHNYNYDIVALEKLISTNCKYIGALGPKMKLNKMLSDLRDKGITIDNETMQNMYGPVGLDIGAETSEEIALSITAEIKAVFSKKQASSLKEKATEIHERSIISQDE